jgi:hypothetical protein
MKTLKPEIGYYLLTINGRDYYQIGGCFRRAGNDGISIIQVIKNFDIPFHGCDEIGLTKDGEKIAYNSNNCNE